MGFNDKRPIISCIVEPSTFNVSLANEQSVVMAIKTRFQTAISDRVLLLICNFIYCNFQYTANVLSKVNVNISQQNWVLSLISNYIAE